MMRRAFCAAVVLGLAGCGDRLRQGDRVVLIASGAEAVPMVGMEVHYSGDLDRARSQTLIGQGGTDDDIPVGTRGVVVDDPGGAADRMVKLRLADGHYRELSGRVPRANLRPE
jgi:hypothetical protein